MSKLPAAMVIVVGIIMGTIGWQRLTPRTETTAHAADKPVSSISPAVDPTTRTVRVRCLVPNPNGLLKPDMFTTINIDRQCSRPCPRFPLVLSL